MLLERRVVVLLLPGLLLQLCDGRLHVLDVLLQDRVLLLELNRLEEQTVSVSHTFFDSARTDLTGTVQLMI